MSSFGDQTNRAILAAMYICPCLHDRLIYRIQNTRSTNRNTVTSMPRPIPSAGKHVSDRVIYDDVDNSALISI